MHVAIPITEVPNPPDDELKAMAAKMHREGKTQRAIAKAVGRSVSTVNEWLNAQQGVPRSLGRGLAMTRSTGAGPTVRAALSYRQCSAEHPADGPNASRTAGPKAAETLAFEVFGQTERQPNNLPGVRSVPNALERFGKSPLQRPVPRRSRKVRVIEP